MKKNNKTKRLFSLRLFIFIATAIVCSLLVLFPGPRTDIVIWAATFWMLIVGAGVVGAGGALPICYQHGWGDSMTGGGDGGGG